MQIFYNNIYNDICSVQLNAKSSEDVLFDIFQRNFQTTFTNNHLTIKY